jgi:hypothetical protein
MPVLGDRTTQEVLVALRERAATIIQQEFAAPEYKLTELVSGVVDELNGEIGDSKKPKNAVRVLKDNPELLASIEREVGPNAKFGFAGIGDNALVLTYDNAEGRRQILRVTTASEGRFEGSEHVLQPHKQGTVGNLTFQHSDIALSLNNVIDDNRRLKDGLTNHAVISQAEANKVMRHLQGNLYNDGLFLHDEHLGNAAITADGKIVTPDPGSIRTVEEYKQRIETFEGSAKAAAKQRFDAVVTEAEHIKSTTPSAPVSTPSVSEPAAVIASPAITTVEGGDQRINLNQVEVEPRAAAVPATAPAAPASAPPAPTVQTSPAPAPATAPPATAHAATDPAPAAARPSVSAGGQAIVHQTGRGVGLAMGVQGLREKLGNEGTLATDRDAGGARSALAHASVVADGASMAGDAAGLAAQVARVTTTTSRVVTSLTGAAETLGRRNLAVATAAGVLETGTALAARDGHRAASALGGTAGGIAVGILAGAAVVTGATLAAPVLAAGAVGVVAMTGASAVAGFVGGYFGAQGGAKLAESLAGDRLHAALNRPSAAEAKIDAQLSKNLSAPEKAGWAKLLGNGDNILTLNELKLSLQASGVSLDKMGKNGDISGKDITDALMAKPAHSVGTRPAQATSGRG